MKLDMVQRFTLAWLAWSFGFGIIAFIISLLIGRYKS